MPYSVDTFSGSKTFVIEDGTIDTSLDIRLIGKNYAGYGEVQNENFVHLLENFANVNPPPKPTNGQIWFDDAGKRIKYWDSSANRWRGTGGIESGSVAPIGPAEGDLWWNTDVEQLFAYNGNQWLLVGPQGLGGFGITRIEPRTVNDTLNVTHPILVAYVDDEIMFVISKDDAFQLSPQSQTDLGGSTYYGVIKSGITLVNTNNATGITNSTRVFWGTVSHSTLSTNLVGGTFGSVPYQSTLNTTVFVESNTTTTRKILAQTGNGITANAPEWVVLPTVLPIAQNSGTILNIPLSNGTFPVVNRAGGTVNITVS
jgi:hypothetical protein